MLWGALVRDLDDLAERLANSASVAASVGDLPAPPLQVLEVLMAVGADATLERAMDLLDASASGPDIEAHRSFVERSLGVLQDAALVWAGADDRLVVNPGAHDVIGCPLGFGRPVEVLLADVPAGDLKKVVARWGLTVPGRKAELVEAVRTYLADPARVRMLLGQAPEPVVRVLVGRSQDAAERTLAGLAGALDDGDQDAYPTYLRDPAAFADHRSAVAWALENGLGFGPDRFSADVEVPSEVLLALVRADFRAPFTPMPPPVVTAPVTPRQVFASASGAITEFLAAGMGTLEAIARTPLVGLKSGGIGARELVKLAKRLGVGAGEVRIALELVSWLELLEGDRAGGLGPSRSFGEWRRRPPAERAADLLTTWLALPYVPSLERDDDGRSLPALARLGGPDLPRAVRILTLRHLEHLDAGLGITTVESVADGIAWRLPLLMADGAALDLPATWSEAQRLGVVAHGRLSDAGTALLAGDRAALVAALAAMLPSVQTTALFGSDLTVIVPGSPDAAVVDLLDAVAVREGRGAASSWRVTPTSVRAALDDGYDAADLEDRLRHLADGVLPQTLEYMIRDVGRRHGHVRVRPAGTVVQSDDIALLAEIVVDRSLRRLVLRRIAPTVVAAEAGAAEVVAALRSAGYLPLELDGAGERVVRLRPTRGSHAGGPAVAAESGPPDVDEPVGIDVPGDATADADEAMRRWAAEFVSGGASGAMAPHEESPAAAAERLTSGVLPPDLDRTTALEFEIRESAPQLSADEARQLAHALEYGESVKIRYHSSTGGLTVRVVSGLSLEHGHLTGWCHLRQDERTFTLKSIFGVAAAPRGA